VRALSQFWVGESIERREMITESTEIDRRPEDVFGYLDELDRHGEWQGAIITTRVETEGPTRVGSRAVDTRKIPGGQRDITYEVTEHDPPHKVAFRGVDGPVRPVGTVTVEPLGDGSRSRVTLELDLQGHGIGKLLAPIARRQAAKEVPHDQAKLKERLEGTQT
jgi:uncharacterized protein YndB with AHSA1/START domain